MDRPRRRGLYCRHVDDATAACSRLLVEAAGPIGAARAGRRLQRDLIIPLARRNRDR